jgi:cysteine synthase A
MKNIADFIGNTPLIKLENDDPGFADVYVKIESFNAGGSHKSRIAKGMVESAVKMGLLQKGMTLIEPTGGNTGIGLAIQAALHGYKLITVVPDNYSKERIELLRYYNAIVELSDSKTGNDSHVVLAKKLVAENPSLIWLDQLSNKASITAHYDGTAKEILDCITPDAFVTCVGSSGTFTGVSRRLKEVAPQTKCFIAQPLGCDIMTGKSIPHKIQGASIGIVPPLLDYNLIDGIINVEFCDAREILRSLVKRQGLFLGISSGVNIFAAIKMAKELGTGKKVCTVAPDSGQYYVNEVYKTDN